MSKIPDDSCVGCQALLALGKIAVALVELEKTREQIIEITGTTEGPARMAQQLNDLIRECFTSSGIGVEDIRRQIGEKIH